MNLHWIVGEGEVQILKSPIWVGLMQVQVLLDPMDTEAMFNIEIIDHVGI